MFPQPSLDEVVVRHNISGGSDFIAAIDATVRGRGLRVELTPPRMDLSGVLEPLMAMMRSFAPPYPLLASLEFQLDVTGSEDVVHERFFQFMDSLRPTQLPGASSLVDRLALTEAGLVALLEEFVHVRDELHENYSAGIHAGDGRIFPVKTLRVTLAPAVYSPLKMP